MAEVSARIAVTFVLAAAVPALAQVQPLPAEKPFGQFEIVATFDAALPTGKSWRRLQNHSTMKPEPAYVPVVETLVHDRRLLWPDTLSLAADGYLYVIANQIHRQASFQGRDLRQKPYVLFRLKVDGTRIAH